MPSFLAHVRAYFAADRKAGLYQQCKAWAEGRSPHWPALRRKFLLRHPTCAACGADKGLEVHHVHPFHLYPAEELSVANLITLCEGCEEDHFVLGHDRNWRLWNPSVRRDAAEKLAERFPDRVFCSTSF